MLDRSKLKFAPRDAFEVVLEWAVIPTFDLVIELAPSQVGSLAEAEASGAPTGSRPAVALVRRRIAPYRDTWALPGLRMFKPETIEDVLRRVALDELGLEIDVDSARFLGQFVGRFRTEHQRQDLSTGDVVRATDGTPTPNPAHFTSWRPITSMADVPRSTGAMYRHYLTRYFDGR